MARLDPSKNEKASLDFYKTTLLQQGIAVNYAKASTPPRQRRESGNYQVLGRGSEKRKKSSPSREEDNSKAINTNGSPES